MNKSLVFVAGVSLLLFGCNSASEDVLSRSTVESQRTTGELEVPQALLGFGPVWSSASFRWTVPFVNNSDRKIEVKSVSTSCGCAVVSSGDGSFVLMPRECRPVGLEIDLRGEPSLPGLTRDFGVGVAAILSDGRQLSWRVQGLVKDAFWLAESRPVRVVRIESDAETTTSIAFLHDPDIEAVAVETNLPHVSASLDRVRQAEGFTVEIKCLPSSAVGTASGYLSITGVQRSTGEQISSTWPIAVETVSELTLEPALLHLGALKHGMAAKFHFRVKSRRNRELGGLRFSLDDQRNVEVCASDEKGGVVLDLKPSSVGSCSFELVILEAQGIGISEKKTRFRFAAEAY